MDDTHCVNVSSNCPIFKIIAMFIHTDTNEVMLCVRRVILLICKTYACIRYMIATYKTSSSPVRHSVSFNCVGLTELLLRPKRVCNISQYAA